LERALLLCAYIKLGLLLIGNSEFTHLVFGFSILLVFVGFWKEGIRIAQFPLVFGLFLVCPLCLIESNYSVVALAFYTLLLLLSTYFFSMGEATYDRYPHTGPYRVGHKKIRTSEKDNEVSVFYPIDEDVYLKWKDTDKDKDFIDKSTLEHFIRGFGNTMSTASRKIMNDPTSLVRTVIKPTLSTKTGVIESAPLARDYLLGSKELIPFIFCHGLASHSSFHVQTAKDYASHGYLVLALNHRDDTCCFYSDKHGKFSYYLSERIDSKERRQAQLKVRISEAVALIDEIQQKH